MDDPDVTRLPIPTSWPQDGGPFMTLPLVVTSDPETGVHNLGMYRSQFSALMKSAFTGRNTSMVQIMLRHQTIGCQLRFALGPPSV